MSLSYDCILQVLKFCDIDTRRAFKVTPGRLVVSKPLQTQLFNIPRPTTDCDDVTSVILYNPQHHGTYGISVRCDEDQWTQSIMHLKQKGTFDIWKTNDWTEYVHRYRNVPVVMMFLVQ